MRPPTPRAEVIKRGRRVINLQVTAWQESRASPVATLRGHFVLSSAAQPA